ncbi:MAG TPA: hypothetical protein DCP92_07615, partial [Nitrospiraceae bacterium]|nr:hypothetical protein [Nitrospiraceae bacterium]
MEKVLSIAWKGLRPFRRLAAAVVMVLALGGGVTCSLAGEPFEVQAYPGAIDYKKGSSDFFDCERRKVLYHYYHTTDAASKAVDFYKDQGFTVIRDD